MKYKSSTILYDFEPIFDALFFTDSFYKKYTGLFDRLIGTDKVKIQPYKETDQLVKDLSEHLENLDELTNLYLQQSCDLMFDLYCRYHVLWEYLESNHDIRLPSNSPKTNFIALLNDYWLKGLPTFSRKNF